MSDANKQLAEKVQMFFNLLYQIDDYIRNKKERKDQLRLSKNFRLVLREVISSKILLNILINNEDSIENYIVKNTFEETQKEKTYIKSINPLSFNQKNLNNINLFYNTNTEIFVINYLVLDKIFSLVRYCFKEIIKQKNKELGNRLGNNSQNFVLNNSVFDEFVFEPETNEENILRKMLKKKEFIINLSKQKNKMKLSKAKSRDINNKKYKNYDASKIISENYNINNLYGKSMNNNHEGDENYLKNQILKINIHNNNNKSLIRNNSVKIIGSLKNNMSLPLIYDRSILNHRLNNLYYKRQKEKMMEEIKLYQKSRNKISNLKYLQNKYIDNNKENPFFKNLVINQYQIKNKNEFVTK